jgi:hypothetical protein
VAATNPEYNQPALRIKQAGERGGAASIRIDDPNPDIEFVETDQDQKDAAAGKYEIAGRKMVGKWSRSEFFFQRFRRIRIKPQENSFTGWKVNFDGTKWGQGEME